MVKNSLAHQVRHLAKILAFLNHEIRISILAILLDSQKPVCVTDIVREMNKNQSYISQQLSRMVNAGLVNYDRKGKKHFYFPVREKIDPILRIIGAGSQLEATYEKKEEATPGKAPATKNPQVEGTWHL